jgi:hypothetical protein
MSKRESAYEIPLFTHSCDAWESIMRGAQCCHPLRSLHLE